MIFLNKKSTLKNIYLTFFFIFLFFSCKKEITNERNHSSFAIKDAFDRTLILHGISTSNFSKFSPDQLPWINEDDVEKTTTYGFNVCRYVIAWNAIEPEKGVFNEQYIAETLKRIKWYTDRKVYVILDMHQDLYSKAFGGGGNGAPIWAVRTNGLPIKTYDFGTTWFLQYLTPEVKAAFQNFWSYKTPNQDLQDHFVLSWLKIIEHVKQNPYVLGYELMNEPHPGDGNLLENGKFETEQLFNFYNKLISEIRKIDNEKYIFIEPAFLKTTGFGDISELPKIRDTRSGDPKIVFTTHLYPFGMETGANYSNIDKSVLNNWKKNRKIEQLKQNSPIVCSEFGGKNNISTSINYLDDVCGNFDDMLCNWIAWSYDYIELVGSVNYNILKPDKTEYPTLSKLIRVYPKATSGELLKFSYDPNNHLFRMQYINDRKINAPTEIFIPKRHFPNGWNLNITGVEHYSKKWDEENQLLSLEIDQDNAIIDIEISSI